MSAGVDEKDTIVCVLKSGIWRPREGLSVSYGPQHVRWLRDQFAKQLTRPHRFICMSDIEVSGVETTPLRDDLPGWWSKLEIFREFRRATYVDLDTVIVGDVSRYLFERHTFTVSDGIHLRQNGAINSSLMCWNGDYRWLYDAFISRKQQVMSEYTCNARWGDQGFIRDATQGRVRLERFQRKFPGAVLHYRRDLQANPQTRREAGRVRVGRDWMKWPRIVFFNGTAKPWNIEEPWIPELAACG